MSEHYFKRADVRARLSESEHPMNLKHGKFKERSEAPSSKDDRFWATDKLSMSIPVPDGNGGLKWWEAGGTADPFGRRG